MNKKIIVNARKVNKMRCISGIVLCSLVILLTFVAVSLSLTDYFNSGSSEAGIGTYKMFTTLSNILAAMAAAMCLPFQIDGLRRDRYKLPYWVVIVMYVGTVGVFLTFITAITIISVYQGFVLTMFYSSSIFMHTISPILVTFLFIMVISDGNIKFKESLLSLVPVAIYMTVYGFMVFVFKVWSDHYMTNAYFPFPVAGLLMLVVSFGISQLIRVLHNLNNKRVKESIERYYLKSPDFEFEKLHFAIVHLAELESKFYYEGDDVYIPVDIIKLLSDRYDAGKFPVDILYDIYLENYLINIGKKAKE